MSLRVIGSGLGRTGTTSLKAALEILGFAPCYHAREYFKRKDHIEAFYMAACHGKPIDWQKMFAGFEATVAAPACAHYEALMKAFPDAKVIHTSRDPESWYDSSYETVYRMGAMFPFWMRWTVKWVRQLTASLDRFWAGFFDGRFEDRAYAIEKFKRYNEAVRAKVPPERLLEYDVKQGWKPLCDFLGVPVPNVPFPHVNDRASLTRQLRWAGITYRWLPVAVAGGLALVVTLVLV